MKSLKIDIGDLVKVKSSYFHNFKEDQIVKITWKHSECNDFYEGETEDGIKQFLRINDIKEVVKGAENKVYHRDEIIKIVDDLLKDKVEELCNETFTEIYLRIFVSEIKINYKKLVMLPAIKKHL